MSRQKHPTWCAQGHRCGLGEHRSEAIPVHDRLVFVLVESERGAKWVEFRGSARLGTEGQAQQLASALSLALRAVLAGEPELLQPMVEATTGRWAA